MDAPHAPKPRVDSLYPSIRSSGTMTPTAARQNQAATKVSPIPGKEVLRFWMPLNPRHKKHYILVLSLVQGDLQTAVAPFLSNGQTPQYKWAFQPMMIGKNEQDAKFHMAVLCEPSLATILEEAFMDPTVQTYLRIPNSNECLEYIVIPEPYEEANARLAIDVFSQTRYETIYNTYCGAPLLLKHRNIVEATTQIRQATFGGIIKVVYAHGEICFYGMTAGHVTNAARQHRHQLSVSSPTDTDPSKDPFSMGAWLSDDDSLGSPLDPEMLPGVKAQRTKLSHDWCIFKTKSPRRNRAVRLYEYESLPGVGDSSEERDHPILIAERPSFDDEASDPVLVLGAAAGTRRGTLSSLPASMFMASCQAFVSVYVLQMSGDHKVVKGDSGAWIVHAAGPAMYGHVVATNMFGEAYVIPANDAFENIRECLGAVSVTLPTTTDLLCGSTARPSPTFTYHHDQSKQLDSRKPHGLLYRIKRWSASFSTYRLVNDRPFLETVKAFDKNQSILETFLLEVDGPHPLWRVKHEQAFLENSKQHVFSSQKVHLDKRYSASSDQFTKWINANEIHSHLKRPESWGYDLSRGHHRRLTFVPKLDAQCISALVENATYHEAEGLRHAVRMHASSSSHLQVYVSRQGIPCYRLVFSLPYFTIGPRSASFCIENLRTYGELLRTNDLLHERYTTVVISGFCDQSWYGYAFGSVGRSEDTEGDLFDSGNIDEDYLGSGNGSHFEDAFAKEGREPSAISPDTIWDPRVYFLHTIRHRAQIANLAYEVLVCQLEYLLKEWRTKVSKNSSRSDALEIILAARELFSRVKDQVQDTNQAWDRFSAKDGDIMYFTDLSNHDVSSVLHEIEDDFDRMKDLESQLERLIQRSKTDIRNLQLLVTLENNRMSQERSNMSRRMTNINLLTSRYSEEACKSALRSSRAAESEERSTRVNVQLFMISFIIMIALQYFAQERPLFSFERTPRTFWITVAILTPGFAFLAFLLNIVDTFRGTIIARWSGIVRDSLVPRSSGKTTFANPESQVV